MNKHIQAKAGKAAICENEQHREAPVTANDFPGPVFALGNQWWLQEAVRLDTVDQVLQVFRLVLVGEPMREFINTVRRVRQVLECNGDDPRLSWRRIRRALGTGRRFWCG